MAEIETKGTRTEAVGVFSDAAPFQEAIDELLSSGFDRADLSLLASENVVEDKLSYFYTRVEDFEDDTTATRTAFVSTEAVGDAEGGLIGGLVYVGAFAAAGAVAASGGTLAAIIAATAMAGGAGGLIGTVLAKLVGDHHARSLQEQIDHGGLLLWVRTTDREQEQRAIDILSKHSAHDVHIHALQS